MAQRHIHYEAAFEDYLRSRGWPYVPVDEQRKAIFAGARIKSFDFLVYPPGRRAWLADVKGRKFPYTDGRTNRYWENWVCADDLEGLRRWHEVFGADFQPLLVFAYWLLAPSERDPPGEVHVFRGSCYAFLGIRAEDYARCARRRSDKWNTLSVPTRWFRQLATPIGEFREQPGRSFTRVG
ncbi:MAG: HYExAFE family protein [Planctomycetota bacterium]